MDFRNVTTNLITRFLNNSPSRSPPSLILTMEFAENATNSTVGFANHSHSYAVPNTAFLGYLHLGLAIVSFISNTFILTVYAKSSQLWTPFSIYVASLSIFDLVNSCTNRFALISTFLNIPWILGNGYCLFALYSTTVITGSIIHTQALISINRLWAVTFPNHYRLHHSKTVSACCEIAVVAYMAAWTLPGFLITDPRSRYNPNNCMYSFGHKSLYFMFTGICTHFFPQIFIITMYPFIYWKVRVVMRRKVQVMQKDHRPSMAATKETGFSANINSNPRAASVAPAGVEISENRKRLRKLAAITNSQRHFAVLTAMLFSVVFFWTPVHVAYGLMIGMDYFDFRFVAVGSLLEAVDCTLNPLLCLLVSREWREAAWMLLKSMK